MISLKGKTIIVTGSSRGIGREIAIRCAKDGANLVVASKTSEPHPKLPGTIFTVADEVKKAGGRALPIKVDVRFEDAVQAMVDKTMETFGCIDALVNNAGALFLAKTGQTPMKKYDLVQSINVRAAFLCSQKVIPHLKKSDNPHIINLSPPITLSPKWYKDNLAYSISKMGMTLCTIGMSAEFDKEGISVNSVWPKTMIATEATKLLLGQDNLGKTRKPAIMAEAIYLLLTSARREVTGQSLSDEDVLKRFGWNDFSEYSMDAKIAPLPDYYLD